MQTSDGNKRVGKHGVKENVPSPAQEEVLRDDFLPDGTDLYGDESDIPLRLRKKRPSNASKKKKGKKKTKKKSTKKTGQKKHLSRHFNIPGLGPNRFRKRRTLFEIMSADGENALFKPIRIFGHEIRFWPLIVLAALLLFVATIFMSNSNVSVDNQNVTVVGLPNDLEDYQLLVISDLNGKRFGDKQSALLRTINNLSYDAVVCLGDMVGKDGDPEPFYELLEGLPSSKKVYFIVGDSDPGPFVEQARDITGTLSQIVLEDWILGAIERGATYVDRPICMAVGSSNLWLTPATMLNLEASNLVSTWRDQTAQEEEGTISGLAADYASLPMTTYRYRMAQGLYSAINSMTEKDICIALAHEPPTQDFLYAANTHKGSSGKYLNDPELTLAGHYCGGVWNLPLVGAFYIPDGMSTRNGWFPAQENVSGLSSIGDSQLYITGGLSINADVPLMGFRLFNTPQISLITLTATLPENMLSAQ